MDPLNGEARAQVGRILRSDVFYHSEGLKRLLSYLAEKTLSAEADQLKEYTIGVDVFGKGEGYDPRLDSGVRLQVSRLRRKLVEYYAADGANDDIVVALPKGRFKLSIERRLPAPVSQSGALTSAAIPARANEERWRRIALVLAGALVALAVVLVAAVVWGIPNMAWRRSQPNAHPDPRWSPPVETFWRPFVQADRPLVIAVGTPLFMGVRGCCFYRDVNQNKWEEAVQDSTFKVFRRTLNNPDFFAVRLFTTVGLTKSVLLVGTLLAPHIQNIHFARSADLSWKQLSDNNALILGTTKSIGDLLASLPVKAEMIMDPTGLRVLHPGNGEAGFYPDQMIGGAGTVSPPDDGDAHSGNAHALISILPGPDGKGFVGSFVANDSGASLAAVEYATNPASIEELLGQLRDESGRVPRYFQVALKVAFRGGVPTGSRYFLKREVRPERNAPDQERPW